MASEGNSTSDTLLKRVEELLKIEWHRKPERSYDIVAEVYTGTLSIADIIWGNNSVQVEAIKQLRRDMESSKWVEDAKAEFCYRQCQGILRSIASDIKDGRLGSIKLEFQGQVFADLINIGKAAIDEGIKEVAAVLAAASLEDALKRFAGAKGLNVDDKDLSEVINALKGAGRLSATQSALLKGMVPFRNKALHAEWSKIDTAEIKGVLGFVEEFLSRHFA